MFIKRVLYKQWKVKVNPILFLLAVLLFDVASIFAEEAQVDSVENKRPQFSLAPT
ncbi:MAG: hypothetical protein ACI8PG_001689 [Planctomycetota bacterium]